jgi:Winged helix DNA-binding domain
VVRWLGAVQAQDYLGSLWAIGLRMQNATEETVEQAIADRTIIRTWPMRGTLHFVAAADVRWMLTLLTPRIVAKSRWRLKQLELDHSVFARSRKTLMRALQGGKQLSRNAMYEALEAAGITTAAGRGLHILWQLAQEGFICFGAREAKHPTFALLEEWAPAAQAKERDAALAELASRYFNSHGPATLQDFSWWSGLTMADARHALEMAKSHLVQEVVKGRTYWLSSSVRTAKDGQPTAHVLPAYDEYTVAYKDRSAVLDPLQAKRASTGNGIFNPIIVINGHVVGTWKRRLEKRSVVITPNLFTSLTKADRHALVMAAGQYGAFLKARVALALHSVPRHNSVRL